MNVRVVITALCLIWLTGLASAQGFAGLGQTTEGFADADPAYRLSFPADHGPHPNHRIEWWYLTATLKDEDGRDYGVQWTLFRSATVPGEGKGWASPQLWMGHAALTTQERHAYAERLARGGIGQAGVTAEPFAAWIDDWQMLGTGDGIDRLTLTARASDFAYALELEAQGPLVLHGADGYSQKAAEGQASHYFSQPFYGVTGWIETESGRVAVTGQGWYDREWSSRVLSGEQTGWDWLALTFEGGNRLAVARTRSDSGIYRAGTWITADGRATALAPDALRLEPLETMQVAGRTLPRRWRVQVPAYGVDVETTPLIDDAWMGTTVPYWEGPVSVFGSHTGRGYLEMTGHE